MSAAAAGAKPGLFPPAQSQSHRMSISTEGRRWRSIQWKSTEAAAMNATAHPSYSQGGIATCQMAVMSALVAAP